MALLASRGGRTGLRSPMAWSDFPTSGNLNRQLNRLLGMIPYDDDGMASVEFFVPPVNVYKKNNNWVVDVYLAGFSKDEVNVDIQDNRLTISGKHEEKEENLDVQYMEASRKEFSRTIALPHDVDANASTATFEDGVLRVTMPSSGLLTARRVAIT